MSIKLMPSIIASVLVSSSAILVHAQDNPGPMEAANRTALLHQVPVSGKPVGAAPDIHSLVEDPVIRDFIGLSENSWDFTDPDSIPGFGSLPQGGPVNGTIK